MIEATFVIIKILETLEIVLKRRHSLLQVEERRNTISTHWMGLVPWTWYEDSLKKRRGKKKIKKQAKPSQAKHIYKEDDQVEIK